MMLKKGDAVLPVLLPAVDGSYFDLNSLKGKRYMLSFYRFASCPFCNMRIHELTKHFKELGDDFSMVAIFDSSLENLQKYAVRHQAPFAILADEQNRFYQQYGITYSISGMLKGMFFRFPTLMKAMFQKGYVPLGIKGRMTTMPADFLVDENGIIQTAFYGKDEGDHLSFAEVKKFALGC